MEETIVFRGSIVRVFVYLSACAFTGILLVALFMRLPSPRILMIGAGYTAGMAIVAAYIYTKDAFSIVFTRDTIEGPVGPGVFSGRKTVHVTEILLERSQPPSLMKSGYLSLKDGSPLMLHNPYYSTRRGSDIIEQIFKRQQAAVNGGPSDYVSNGNTTCNE